MSPFRAVFVDGPWAGQSLTLDDKVRDFHVTRAGDPSKNTQDSIFIYEPSPSKFVNGIEESEFKIKYDGPINGRPHEARMA